MSGAGRREREEGGRARDLRSFVAVPLDGATTASLVALSGELARLAPAVRWVAPELMHVTLKFLGGVAEARIGEVAGAVRGALAGCGSFDVEVAGVGGFPGAARPRVVWAGIAAGARELDGLARAVGRAVEPLGFPPEERGFRAHVTLARIKARLDGAAELALSQALTAGAGRPVGRFRVDRVQLMHSDTVGGRPCYTPLETFALEAA